MKDRRSAERGRVTWPVTLETFEGRIIHGEVVDASVSGMRVRADVELAAGTGVTASVMLPRGADRLEVVARVLRASDGIALDFVGLPQTEARRLRALMATWEARRRAPRVLARIPIELARARGRPVSAHLVDLSAFGAKVGADEAVQAGERLTVRLAAVDGDGGLALGAIVWDVTRRGTVLLFVNLREPDFRRLEAYLGELLRRTP